MATGDNDVELARHDIKIERIVADIARLSTELEKEREARGDLQKIVDDIMRWGAFARIVFISAIAVGGFGSWLLGVTDHVRKLFFSHQ